MYQIALKKTDGTWKSIKIPPQFKFIKTFSTGREAVDYFKPFKDAVERYLNEYPGLKIVETKYTRDKIREQDIIEEYTEPGLREELEKALVEIKEKEKKRHEELEKLHSQVVAVEKEVKDEQEKSANV